MSCSDCGFVCGAGSECNGVHEKCPCCGAAAFNVGEEDGEDLEGLVEVESIESVSPEAVAKIGKVLEKVYDLPSASTKEYVRGQSEAKKKAPQSTDCPQYKKQMNRGYRCKKCSVVYCVDCIYEHTENCPVVVRT